MCLESSGAESHEHAEHGRDQDELGAGRDGLGRVAIVRVAAKNCAVRAGRAGAGSVRAEGRRRAQIARLGRHARHSVFLFFF